MSIRLSADERRAQLERIASRMFADAGYHGVSMEQLADAAGVSKPVLYQHFPSKRALYVELLEDVRAGLLGRLTDATGSVATGRARVEAGFAAYFRFVTEHRSSFRLLFGASVRNDPEFAAVAEATVHDAAAAIVPLIDIPAPEEQRLVLADALVGMAEATSRRVLADPTAEQDATALAHWVSQLAWFGLRGVRPDDDHDGGQDGDHDGEGGQRAAVPTP